MGYHNYMKYGFHSFHTSHAFHFHIPRIPYIHPKHSIYTSHTFYILIPHILYTELFCTSHPMCKINAWDVWKECVGWVKGMKPKCIFYYNQFLYIYNSAIFWLKIYKKEYKYGYYTLSPSNQNLTYIFIKKDGKYIFHVYGNILIYLYISNGKNPNF